MRVTPLFFFLQKKCMEKCKKPTMPAVLADEENDPHHHENHRSLPPNVVSSACFIAILYLYSLAPNYPMKKGGRPYDKIGNARCLPLRFISRILVSLRVFRKKKHHYFSIKVSNFPTSIPDHFTWKFPSLNQIVSCCKVK